MRVEADRQGYTLYKSHERDTRIPSYGKYLIEDQFGGEFITPDWLTADEVEQFLDQGKVKAVAHEPT